MPIEKSKKIDLENFQIPDQVLNTKDYGKSVKYEKKVQGVLPTLSIPEDLIREFRNEAKQRKWTLTTLMEEILMERYGHKEWK